MSYKNRYTVSQDIITTNRGFHYFIIPQPSTGLEMAAGRWSFSKQSSIMAMQKWNMTVSKNIDGQPPKWTKTT